MQAVGGIVRRLIHPGVAHQIHDGNLRKGVGDRRGHAHRGALCRLPLRQRRARQKGHAPDVRHVQDDDPGVSRPCAESGEKREVVVAKIPYLLVDECGLIARAGAAAQRRGDDVHFVDAGGDGDEGGLACHKRQGVLDQITGDEPTVLAPEVLKGTADDAGREAMVRDSNRVPLRPQLSRGDEDVSGAVGAVGIWQTGDARANTGHVAGSDRRVNDCGAR